jgi:hypothetical protein
MTVILPQTQTHGLRLAIAPLSGCVQPLLLVPRSWIQAGRRNRHGSNAGKRKRPRADFPRAKGR